MIVIKKGISLTGRTLQRVFKIFYKISSYKRLEINLSKLKKFNKSKMSKVRFILTNKRTKTLRRARRATRARRIRRANRLRKWRKERITVNKVQKKFSNQ